MKLLTKAIEEKFKKYGLTGQVGKGVNSKILVKYFNPIGQGTWLITGAKKEGNDWLLFGFCHIFEGEWGYVSLKELENIKLPFGLGIERDLHIDENTTVNEECKRLGIPVYG